MCIKNSLPGFKNPLFCSFTAFFQELTLNTNKIILPNFTRWYSHRWPHGYFYHRSHGCSFGLTVRTEVAKICARFTSVRSLVRVQYRPPPSRANALGFFVAFWAFWGGFLVVNTLLLRCEFAATSERTGTNRGYSGGLNSHTQLQIVMDNYCGRHCPPDWRFDLTDRLAWVGFFILESIR